MTFRMSSGVLEEPLLLARMVTKSTSTTPKTLTSKKLSSSRGRSRV